MEFTGKTVEEAIADGLETLDLKKENAEIKIIEEPSKGLFRKVKGQAVVDITEKAKVDGFNKAIEFVGTVLKMLDINAKAEAVEGENATINIIAEKSSEVIGYRGEMLDAIQTLAGAVANIGEKDYKKVVVNCENYRERREDTLIALAHKLEEKATEMRREVILEPMIPFERRIIHTALAESATVTTKSEGKEPNRYVVIVPNEKDEFSRPYNAGRNGGGNRHGQGRKDFKGGHKDFKKKGGSGFSEVKRAKSSGFGTFLGNSKDL